MVEIVALITLVAGVLQIILFFKIWGMTNDIRALKRDHFIEIDIESNDYLKANFARKHLILGEKNKVKTMLLKNFLANISDNFTKNEDTIRPYVENLKKQYSKLGEELPEYISKMETFGDYYNLFRKDDFIVGNK